LATACFNYFFLPPIGTFHIADLANWVALVCFLIATTVASRLVVRERLRAEEADSRRREIAALYELCVDLFTASATRGGLNAAAARALRAIGVQSGGLILAGDSADGEDHWVGTATDLEVHRLLDAPGAAHDSGSAGPGGRSLRLPVAVGAHTVGQLVVYGTRAGRATLESVARLLGLAVERERLLAERARLAALQESDALKTALLQAVSHDLSTPLTAITILLQSLKRALAQDEEGSRDVEQVREETARLQRRIENLLAMARLQAGGSPPHREPTPAADLFRAAREHLQLVAPARRLEVRVARDCLDLDVDPPLVVEALVNLLENADRASPSGVAIELLAQCHPENAACVRIEILDRGSGLLDTPHGRPGSAAGGPRKGLGLEIARSFAVAHGGSLSLVPRAGGGVCARLDLPAALLGQDLAGAR
jgi:two-component system sensor histidine kinase KdpD